MAKQDDDDFDAFSSNEAPDSGPGSKTGRMSGLLAKLPSPVLKILEKIRDFFENIGLAVSSAFNDKERPFMPLLMLGGASLVLLLLVIVMVAVLGSALSGNQAAAPKTVQVGNSANVAAGDTNPDAAPDATALSNSAPVDLGLQDSFLGQAILPNEPEFILKGEIHYHRAAQAFWSTADIKPGWQDLGTLYRTMLRERNRADFYRLMGEAPPPRDPY